MTCERSWISMLLECWERRIDDRLDALFRVFDPVKKITRRLYPNDPISGLHRIRFRGKGPSRWTNIVGGDCHG